MKQTVRIPRYLAADWARLRDHIAAQRAEIGDPQPVTDAVVLATAVTAACVAMKVPGVTGIVPQEGAPYEAPPPEVAPKPLTWEEFEAAKKEALDEAAEQIDELLRKHYPEWFVEESYQGRQVRTHGPIFCCR